MSVLFGGHLSNDLITASVPTCRQTREHGGQEEPVILGQNATLLRPKKYFRVRLQILLMTTKYTMKEGKCS